VHVIAKTKHLFYVTTFALILVAFACAMLLSGCPSTRQTLKVQLPEDIPASWQAGITDDQKLPITSSLIDLIGEEQLLCRLIEEAMENNPRGELFSDADLPLIISPPVTTPAAVLLKRPDIQATLARAEAAVKLSSAADKALLPNLSLSGRIFKQSAHLNSLGSATGYWNILGSLFQPLFEGGRIISESRARHTEAEAALMELHEVVLNAVKEVEDAFGVERDLARQSQAFKLAAHESEKSSRYYEERYRQGLDTILSLLMSKEQEMSVRIRLDEVAARRLANRVDLALALGVGIEEPAMPVGDRTP
jgi:outer membrane protein TolC